MLNTPSIPGIDALITDPDIHYQTNEAWLAIKDEKQEKYLSRILPLAGACRYPEGYNVSTDPAYIGRDLPVIIYEARSHPTYSVLPYVLDGSCVFMAFAPIRTKDGYTVASVDIDDPVPRYTFSLRDTIYLMETTRKIKDILKV